MRSNIGDSDVERTLWVLGREQQFPTAHGGHLGFSCQVNDVAVISINSHNLLYDANSNNLTVDFHLLPWSSAPRFFIATGNGLRGHGGNLNSRAQVEWQNAEMTALADDGKVFLPRRSSMNQDFSNHRSRDPNGFLFLG